MTNQNTTLESRSKRSTIDDDAGRSSEDDERAVPNGIQAVDVRREPPAPPEPPAPEQVTPWWLVGVALVGGLLVGGLLVLAYTGRLPPLTEVMPA